MAFARPVRRILLVALDNLGDLVFASALTPPLHDAFPDATIDLWCKKYTAPIGPLIPHISDVIAADPFWAVPPHRPRPPIQPFLRSVGAIRRRRYDVAVVSEAPWRTAAAVAAPHLHKADAALDHAPGEQAVGRVGPCELLVDAVHFERRWRLLGKIQQLRSRHLHAESQLVSLYARVDFVIAGVPVM